MGGLMPTWWLQLVSRRINSRLKPQQNLRVRRSAHCQSKMASALGVLIIPGSFSYSSYYYDVVDRIKRDGYDAYVANLPSVIREPPESPATLSDDANHIRNIISTLAEQGKDVIVLAHSYGGVVASQAVSGVLKTDREAIGLLGGVVRLVYLTATVMPEGLSMDEYIRRPEGLFTTSTVRSLYGLLARTTLLIAHHRRAIQGSLPLI